MAGDFAENGDPQDDPLEEQSESTDDSVDEPIDDFAEQKFTVSPAGRELFVAVFAIERWLEDAPGGPLSLVEDDAAQAIVGSFIEGWNSCITHALADGPLTLTELERRIEESDREELEAKVAAMRGTGLLSARPSDSEGATYAVTDWLREGVGPMVVAMRSELRQAAVLAEEEEEPLPDDPSFLRSDVEAAFMLALPLLELPSHLSGVCRLVVDLPDDDEGLAGATIRVEGGRVASCSVDLEGDADAWALGPALTWMDTAIEGEPQLDPEAPRLDFGGDQTLARAVLTSLHERLFAAEA